MIKKIFTFLLDFFFPSVCFGCNRGVKEGRCICKDCLEEIERVNSYEPTIDLNDLIISPSEDHYLTLVEDFVSLGITLGYSKTQIIESFLEN